MGARSGKRLELKDELEESEENQDGKSAKKICDEQVQSRFRLSAHLKRRSKVCTQCKADKAAVEERMKQLRNMINSDFDNMVDYGKKVGYLPPPRSIEEQVMDGTLLGGDEIQLPEITANQMIHGGMIQTLNESGTGKTGEDAKAPPAFSGNKLIRNLPLVKEPLQVHVSSKEAGGEGDSADAGDTSAPQADDSGGDAPVVDLPADVAADAADTPADALPDGAADAPADVVPAASASHRAAYGGGGLDAAGRASRSIVDDDDAVDMAPKDGTDAPADLGSCAAPPSAAAPRLTAGMTLRGDRGGAAAWSKAFAFMKDTDNPLLGRGSQDRPGGAATGGGGDDEDGREAAREIGAAAAGGDAADPLRSDRFLRGFFGR